MGKLNIEGGFEVRKVMVARRWSIGLFLLGQEGGEQLPKGHGQVVAYLRPAVNQRLNGTRAALSRSDGGAFSRSCGNAQRL